MSHSIYDVLGIYKDCITLDGDNVVTLGYIGDKFPVIARELESLGYRYSRENSEELEKALVHYMECDLS